LGEVIGTDFYHRDLNSYQDVISTFDLPVLHERFEFIRQLGSVFIVRPDAIKSYITDNYLGRIDPILLRPYLIQRSDWSNIEKSFKIGFELGDEAVEGKGLGERFGLGRLSVMMKEMEGLKLAENIPIPTLPSGLAGNFSVSSKAQ
jgi:exocyst complex component 5